MPVIRSEMRREGAVVNGSDAAGDFAANTPVGPIAAMYRLDGKSVEVTITQKSDAVSFGQIQDKLTDAALDAGAVLGR